MMLVVVLMATAFLLGRYLHRRQSFAEDLSPVTRQHLDLYQGGQLNEAAVETAKTRFRNLLERGEVATVEASLRPGTHYVVLVRALAEIGTDDAGRILERQLGRRLTEDQIEQSWYWIDLASGLRTLNRAQSLPHLLRCAASAGEVPLGHFFAAETVCFLGFVGYLRNAATPLGRTALRVLHRALEGMRCGVQPQVFAEGRLGEAIETLWDNRPEQIDPLVVRVFAESLRQLRRAPHAERMLADEPGELEAFHLQMSRLAALEPVLEDYLDESPALLQAALAGAIRPDQGDLLLALNDLRADAAQAILPLLPVVKGPPAELAVEVLTWSSDPRVGPFLREWAAQRIPMDRRALQRARPAVPRRRSFPSDIPYAAILRALRGHPSEASEMFLLLAARDWDPTIRAAAVSSLGWWEPCHPSEVRWCLKEARRESNLEVRQAARAALARLGECQALQWFRQALVAEDSHRIHDAVQAVAVEGITLLWPDLDRLADADDPDISLHARDALERLREDLHFPSS